MANLEESQDVDLDAILGELSALETQCDQASSFFFAITKMFYALTPTGRN